MFFGRQKWVEEHNNLVLQYQETITLIKNSKKTVQDKHIEQAKRLLKSINLSLGKGLKQYYLKGHLCFREKRNLYKVYEKSMKKMNKNN